MSFAFNDSYFHLETVTLAVLSAGNALPPNMCRACTSLYPILSSNTTFSETEYPSPPTWDSCLLTPRTTTSVTNWSPCTAWSVSSTRRELHQGWVWPLSFLLKTALDKCWSKLTLFQYNLSTCGDISKVNIIILDLWENG